VVFPYRLLGAFVFVWVLFIALAIIVLCLMLRLKKCDVGFLLYIMFNCAGYVTICYIPIAYDIHPIHLPWYIPINIPVIVLSIFVGSRLRVRHSEDLGEKREKHKNHKNRDSSGTRQNGGMMTYFKGDKNGEDKG
jgi:hypothetical protein